MHNIEKSAFRRGTYVGYGKVLWHIKRNGKTWRAWTHGVDARSFDTFERATLREVSKEIEARNV